MSRGNWECIRVKYRDRRVHIILDFMLQCDIKFPSTKWYTLNESYPKKPHLVYHHRHSCVQHSGYHIVLILLCLKRSRTRFSRGRKLPLFIPFICPNHHWVVGSFCFASCRSVSIQGQAIHTARSLFASF
jgi:hypothetical protein